MLLKLLPENFNGCDMGNQLSTWNLSIQSAVDGENFNYNPDYNVTVDEVDRLVNNNRPNSKQLIVQNDISSTNLGFVNPSLRGSTASVNGANPSSAILNKNRNITQV